MKIRERIIENKDFFIAGTKIGLRELLRLKPQPVREIGRGVASRRLLHQDKAFLRVKNQG